MKIHAQVDIRAPKQAVWKTITDIKNAPSRISGIQKVEILEQPPSGLVGLKWRETRTMFGKTATEVMWITRAVENSYYETRAESHGAIYISRMSVEEQQGSTLLSMDFSGEPQTTGTKLMMALMGWMVIGATRKAVQKDLEEIKKAVEAGV